MFELPFTEPVSVFAIVILVILVSPILFSRMRVPGLVGLILSGVLLGPHAFHILERDSSIILFGTVGLLYIMFMAGLEMDMHDFQRNKSKSLVFGALTFIFPFVLGFVAAHFILHYSMLASVLLASMFSTHTLISYPLLNKLGITQSRTVAIIIGGTIITDGVVLLILAVITNVTEDALNVLFFIKFFALLAMMVVAILWGAPRLGRWFFRNLESEGHAQYLFVLAVVFLSGCLAHIVGVEPIIGAFLAGLALNQLIPNTSTLMNRIEFVGNTIFIPFFLISVGMLVDFRVLLNGPQALLIALLIMIISFTGKWLAAWSTQKLYGFNQTERRFIWGMSSAHAAATIAVVIIGYNLELLDENVLNGTILLILVSCLVSSLITEHAGRKIALEEESRLPELPVREERILVPVANLQNVDRLIDTAIMIRNPKSINPVTPLFVIQNSHAADDAIIRYRAQMEKSLKDSAIETEKEPVFRVDVNVGNGILRALTELRVTHIVMGWNGKETTGYYWGPILDRLINNASQQLMICKLLQPINTVKRIILAIPTHAEREAGFSQWSDSVLQLAKVAGAKLLVFSQQRTFDAFNSYVQKSDKAQEVDFRVFESWLSLHSIHQEVRPHDLFLIVMARKQTRSYHSAMTKIPDLMTRFFGEVNAIVLYPEQKWRGRLQGG